MINRISRLGFTRFIALLAFIVISLSWYTISYINDNSEIRSTHTNTITDLSKTIFNDKLMISLSGAWLKTDSEMNSSVCTFPMDLYTDTTGDYSYSLKLILPEGNNYYTLLIPEIYKEYSLFINNKLIYENTDKNGAVIIPHDTPIKFYADSTDLSITILAKEKDIFHRTIKNDILIGLPSAAQHHIFSKMLSCLMFLSLFVLTFIYYLAIFINNPKNIECFSFSILCIGPIIKVLTTNNDFLYSFFPFITLPQFYYIDSFTTIITFLLLISHIDSLFPNCINKKLSYLSIILMFVYVISSFLIPTTYGKYFLIAYNLIYCLNILILIMACVKAYRNEKENAIFHLLGISLIFAGMIADAILFNRYVTLSSFYTVTFSVYILLQIELFLRMRVRTYQSEMEITDSYSHSISQIKTEETNFLSAHLKAHFLFNALNIISGYSLFDQEKAKLITKALIVYLKQLFEHDNLNELNSLENEMELVKAFALIELERFPGLTINYDMPDELPDLMMPSLTLQPLLENAINHGVRKKNSKGTGNVIISIKPFKNYMYFTIKDDGAGQDEITLKKAIEENTDGKFHSLYHIQDRLDKLYNEKIAVRSITNVGTFISFKIPIDQTSKSS